MEKLVGRLRGEFLMAAERLLRMVERRMHHRQAVVRAAERQAVVRAAVVRAAERQAVIWAAEVLEVEVREQPEEDPEAVAEEDQE